MSHSDDEEFDRRFQALIRAEFGDVAGAGPPGEPAAPPKADRPQSRRFGARKLKDPIEYFNLSKAIEEATRTTITSAGARRWNRLGEGHG